jgi:hypothetical protein
MTPLAESGAVHAFSPSTSTWRRLNPTTSDFPCARSYHTSTASPTHLIIHAGCGDAVTGRLNDTWAFEPSSRAWTKLDDAPGDPRGGPGLTWIHDRIWRFGGFNGEVEIGGSIDYLPFSRNDSKDATRPSWSSILYSQSSNDSTPGARSVAGLHPLGNTYDLVTFFGEGRPSPTGGHDSAGNFWGDVWVFSPLTEKWSEVVIESDGESGDGPGERGWFASDVDEKGRVVLWGGIDGRNERLGDGWVLSSA